MGLLAASGRHSLTSLLRAVGGAKDSMSCPLFTSSPGNPAGPSPGGDRGPAGDRWTARRSVVWATQRWPGAGGTAHRLGASTGTGAALPRGGRARDEPHACQIIYVRPSAAGNSVAKCDQFCGSGRGGRPRFVRWLCRGRAGVYCTPLQIGKLSPTGDKCVAGSREEKRAFSWCNSVLLSIRFSRICLKSSSGERRQQRSRPRAQGKLASAGMAREGQGQGAWRGGGVQPHPAGAPSPTP